MILESLPDGVNLGDIDIWFQDEMRVGQQGSITRMWAIKGTRPRSARQQKFEYSYIYGAVCPKNSTAVGLILPKTNIYCMELHLKEIAKTVPANRHAVIVLDGAGWHSKNLATPKNITLLKLPPYSPELNPVEQVWQYLRQHFLSNRCFSDYEAIVNACDKAWNLFAKNTALIKSLCTRSYACI